MYAYDVLNQRIRLRNLSYVFIRCAVRVAHHEPLEGQKMSSQNGYVILSELDLIETQCTVLVAKRSIISDPDCSMHTNKQYKIVCKRGFHSSNG